MKPFDNLIELGILNEMGVFQDYEAIQYKHKSDQILSLFTPSISTPSSFFLVLEGGITNQMMMDELQSLQSYITKRFDSIHQDLEGLILNQREAFQEDGGDDGDKQTYLFYLMFQHFRGILKLLALYSHVLLIMYYGTLLLVSQTMHTWL